MKWDPELTALADQVRETFGRRALADAYVRALVAAPRTECPPELELFEDDDQISVVDSEASAASLKSELRRMLTRH
jgi:catalase (peroxidase I)